MLLYSGSSGGRLFQDFLEGITRLALSRSAPELTGAGLLNRSRKIEAMAVTENGAVHQGIRLETGRTRKVQDLRLKPGFVNIIKSFNPADISERVPGW